MSQQVEREALKRKRAQQRRITLLEYTKGQTFNQAEFKQRVAGGKYYNGGTLSCNRCSESIS